MEILQYKPDYLESVIRTWEHASRVGHPFLSKEFVSSEKNNIPAVYLPNGDAWVALIQKDVVGFMILHDNEIGALFVQPEFHGQGIGHALVNKAYELHGELYVEVFKKNVIGTKFYSRYGFHFVREYMHTESGMTMLCLNYKKNPN